MEDIKETIEPVRDAMVKTLGELVLEGLEEANMAIVNQAIARANPNQSLHDEKEAIAERFRANMGACFDSLLGDKASDVDVLDYGGLSLVGDEDLEAIIALEGMIAHARNCDIQEYLSFTTRLDTVIFSTKIDESNNPMDPEQIGDAFKKAMGSTGLSSAELLLVYRGFNSKVFHNLEKVLEEANEILIAKGIIPKLDIAARSKKLQKNKRSKRREKTDPNERAFSNPEQDLATQVGQTQQMLLMMQKLMHREVSEEGPALVELEQSAELQATKINFPQAKPGLSQGMMIGAQRVEMLASDQLLNYLNEIQSSANGSGSSTKIGTAPEKLDKSIGELLQSKSDNDVLKAVDSQSSDIINLITLLYDAIWHDETVPIPIKELIGRTQITALKIALEDPQFFDSDTHPARVLINELATAGISWTEFDKLETDPMYAKMQELVASLINDFEGDLEFLESLTEEFKQFKRDQLMAVAGAEENLRDADERKNRLHEIHAYAEEKIFERILDDNLDPFVKEFLGNMFHKFVVQLILREGPGGISWKPVMNTIDVLLWTVQTEKADGDLERFIKVNPRLMLNLGKALEVGGIDKEATEIALKELQGVQDSCFKPPEESNGEKGQSESSEGMVVSESKRKESVPQESLSADDEHMQEVNKYAVGIWLEFQAEGDQTIRCTLAAKIDTIDKFVFVNGQGVKVIEKSKMGLARELKAGTVKVISEAPLIDRAMESVIGKLREGASH